MQTHHPRPRHRPSPRRRTSVRAAVAASVVSAALVALAPTADAAPRPSTKSETVADSAERALDALERWQASSRPAHYVRYLKARDRTAELLAGEVGLPGAALVAEWDEVGELQQVAVLSALTQLGVPYRRYKSEADVGFDCSGLTSWAWAEAGVEMPRTSRGQIRNADSVDEADVEAGFLVYYPGHVSMYVGEGFMVHAPYTGSHVEVVPVSSRTSAYADPVTDDAVEALEVFEAFQVAEPPASIF